MPSLPKNWRRCEVRDLEFLDPFRARLVHDKYMP